MTSSLPGRKKAHVVLPVPGETRRLSPLSRSSV
jgi:hypothetical protein